ncbi:transcriptional regulator swi6 [Rhizophlyctis rosea]|uniref:tRNA (guanine-N(7)-)-methyltransferase n=1 Tax=Rhizophlyctis rosea TaxID=64517 RepID=A0AAD5S4P6_9FUNG|nr:transcriptional regulator swi6 [Rhizophlyctis rosea]
MEGQIAGTETWIGRLEGQIAETEAGTRMRHMEGNDIDLFRLLLCNNRGSYDHRSVLLPKSTTPPLLLLINTTSPLAKNPVHGTVMRRKSDSWLNATQILKVAQVGKVLRRRVLREDIRVGAHEQVPGEFGKYQGTWVPFSIGVEIAKKYGVENLLQPLIKSEPPPERPMKKEGSIGIRRKKYASSKLSEMTRGETDDDRAESPDVEVLSGEAEETIENRSRHRVALLQMFVQTDPEYIPDILALPPPDLDVNLVIDDLGHTCTHWASAHARIPLLRHLVDRGADVRRPNNSGETPLMRAVLITDNYDNQTFMDLLEYLHPSITQIDRKGRTVLHHIASTIGMKGRAQAARYYMECVVEWIARSMGGSLSCLVNIVNVQDKSGDTALNIAARFGNRNLMVQFLELGADGWIANDALLRPADFEFDDLIESAKVGTAGRGERVVEESRGMPQDASTSTHPIEAGDSESDHDVSSKAGSRDRSPSPLFSDVHDPPPASTQNYPRHWRQPSKRVRIREEDRLEGRDDVKRLKLHGGGTKGVIKRFEQAEVGRIAGTNERANRTRVLKMKQRYTEAVGAQDPAEPLFAVMHGGSTPCRKYRFERVKTSGTLGNGKAEKTKVKQRKQVHLSPFGTGIRDEQRTQSVILAYPARAHRHDGLVTNHLSGIRACTIIQVVCGVWKPDERNAFAEMKEAVNADPNIKGYTPYVHFRFPADASRPTLHPLKSHRRHILVFHDRKQSLTSMKIKTKGWRMKLRDFDFRYHGGTPVDNLVMLNPVQPEEYDWSKHYPAHFPAPGTNGETSGKLVEFADIGCGYRGSIDRTLTTIPINPHAGNGDPCRVKVEEMVEKRIQALRTQNASKGRDEAESYQNISVSRMSAMNLLSTFFKKGQLSKLFFVLPSPHFETQEHAGNITSTFLAECSYVLRPDGILYHVTTIQDLHLWMVKHLDEHPLFARIPEQDLKDDPCVPCVMGETEEGRKAGREKGDKFLAVYRRLEKRNALDQVADNYEEDSDSMSWDDQGTGVGEKGRKQPAPQGYCVECEDQPASVYCEQCADDYCDVCFHAQHRNDNKKRHTCKALATQVLLKKAKGLNWKATESYFPANLLQSSLFHKGTFQDPASSKSDDTLADWFEGVERVWFDKNENASDVDSVVETAYKAWREEVQYDMVMGVGEGAYLAALLLENLRTLERFGPKSVIIFPHAHFSKPLANPIDIPCLIYTNEEQNESEKAAIASFVKPKVVKGSFGTFMPIKTAIVREGVEWFFGHTRVEQDDPSKNLGEHVRRLKWGL